MSYTQQGYLDRSLTDEEEKSFRQWARDNYHPYDAIKEFWHPVVKDECKRINDDYDPTPWCNYCGAMSSRECDCGPLADND